AGAVFVGFIVHRGGYKPLDFVGVSAFAHPFLFFLFFFFFFFFFLIFFFFFFIFFVFFLGVVFFFLG
ncbi:hypothetical protein, partial [Stenotrophomonas maltophilia]|uniref:hypothetical protein n=1 Tax=Stenotrophomonas maltophilia TaxID=40324 RepID=UPI0034E195DA